ncbi:MAG: guanylate kinase, partial [Dehalococcoidales bacterium]
MSGLSYKPSSGPLLLILSGPSGVGKDAILSRMKELDRPLEFVVTMTTRPRRPVETDNVDYRFVSDETFQQMLKENKLLEWANVYGYFYGVPKEPIRKALKKGRDVIAKVDVQGAATIKKLMPRAVLIFLMPPSMEELATRLKQRLTESAEAMTRRLATAEAEIKKLPIFDYAVINRQGEIDQAVKEIAAIITAEKC